MGSAARMGLLGGERRAIKSSWIGGWKLVGCRETAGDEVARLRNSAR